jgi:S-adenosyl-L-methionine hydrolase (adenosine-forming)
VVASRPIVFCSDYGLADEFVGVCHGVIARVAPQVRVVDLTHGIAAHDVRQGALTLAQAARYMPEAAVFLAVVDPGVGSTRRAVAVEAASGASLVGPDNGLLSLTWQGLGGAVRAVEITSPDVVLQPPSRTFHGRDVFAPAAAHLANGSPLDDLGPEVGVDSLTSLRGPEPAVAQGRVTCAVLGVDRFGNVQLACRGEDLERAGLGDVPLLDLHADLAASTLRRAETFSDVPAGALALIVDSRGWLAVTLNGGSAAAALSLGPQDTVALSAAAG